MARVFSRSTASDALPAEADERCPNCSSTRYMNANIRFLISDKCYHKMCATCVDRIFGPGPATCPIAGCKEVLRKTSFRKQTFQDAKIEREVDLRRRIDKVLGGYEEDDFVDLRAFNDYLEMVEDLAYDLSNSVNFARNIKKLEDLEAKQREKANAGRRNFNLDMGRIMPGVKKAPGQKPGKVGEGKSAAAAAPAPDEDADANGSATGLVIRGLRAKEQKLKEQGLEEKLDVFDPFGRIKFAPVHHRLLGRYDNPKLAFYRDKANEQFLVGGYDLDAYCQRSLVDAFGGLGVFVDEERDSAVSAAVEGKVAAGQAVVAKEKKKQRGTVQDDDVF